MRTPLLRQRGFTLIETAIVAGLVSLSLATVGGVFKTSSGLADDSRANLRVHEEHRRNLEAVATVLRGGDLETLSGFSADGTSTNPSFERVTGAGQEGLTTGGTEELRWVASPAPIDGIANAGMVVHITATGSTVVADRVPQGGFLVRQEGGNLVIRLTTYYTTSQRKTALLTGETAVFMRN